MVNTPAPEGNRPRGRRRGSDVSGRDALLKAAVRCFAAHGYDSASLRMIAREAEVDVALCARLFGNKAKLWQAVIDDVAEQFELKRRPLLDQMLKKSEQDPEGAIRDFIVFYADLCVENPVFPAFILQEAIVSEPRIEIIKERLIAPLMRPFMQMAERAREAGIIRFNDPVLYVRMLASSISQLLVVPNMLPRRILSQGDLKQRVIADAQAIFLHSPQSQSRTDN